MSNHNETLNLQTVTQSAEEEHPIALLFPLEVEVLEDSWPDDWSWSDDMVTF